MAMAKTSGRSNNKSSSKTSSSSSTKSNNKPSRGERGMMTPKAGVTVSRRKVNYGGDFCY